MNSKGDGVNNGGREASQQANQKKREREKVRGEALQRRRGWAWVVSPYKKGDFQFMGL